MFEAAVEGLGRAVGAAGPVEVGKDVSRSVLECSAERAEFDERGRDAVAEAGDQVVHQVAAASRVSLAVGDDHSLVGRPGDLDGGVGVVGEQLLEPGLLFVCR